MARTLSFDGQMVASPAAITVTLDGAQIFSGAVGADAELDTDITLATADVIDLPDTASTAEMTISITSGVVRIGEVWANIAGGEVGLKGIAHRSNILVNGEAPVAPAPDHVPQPEADWVGWRFELSAGETISFTLAVDAADTPTSV